MAKADSSVTIQRQWTGRLELENHLKAAHDSPYHHYALIVWEHFTEEELEAHHGVCHTRGHVSHPHEHPQEPA